MIQAKLAHKYLFSSHICTDLSAIMLVRFILSSQCVIARDIKMVFFSNEYGFIARRDNAGM